MPRFRTLAIGLALIGSMIPVTSSASGPEAQDRSVEPVVLRGSQFPAWSAGPDPTFREPQTPTNYGTADIQQYLPGPLQSDCYKKSRNEYDPKDNGDHNCYQSSRLPRNPLEGKPVDRLLGFRWNGSAFEQIPFQVDERFTRYISNNASGFAFYSGVDYHNGYAWDREGFRFTADESQYVDGGDSCLAKPAKNTDGSMGPSTMADPVKGLDDDDELVFMYSDAAGQAPPRASLPAGIVEASEIVVADPTNPAHVTYAYVMLAGPGGPAPAFDASNGYVRYERDANADRFAYSQSSYSNYGAAPKGPHCDPLTGELVRNPDGTAKIAQRRPLDGAWVRT
ncbi:MAG TPA: hypothetical protein VM600_09910, partial [Actinomycetota bacterium]|nr:hypothetical protein [Actinomycetota bacterium]